MFEFHAYTDSGEEVAQGKTATQSSNYRNDIKFAASHALDGDISTFSHTYDAAATWKVDLAQVYNISLISIKNRYCQDNSDKPGCLCKLSHATVKLLDEQGNVVKSSIFDDTCGDMNPALNFDLCVSDCNHLLWL